MTVYLLERRIPWTEKTFVAVGVFGSQEEAQERANEGYDDIRIREFNISTQGSLFNHIWGHGDGKYD